MFERILVPLDGSAQAARAVPVAARIAESNHGSVILVSVVNYFVLSQSPRTDRNNRTRIGDDLSMSEAEAYLDEIACSPELAHVTVEKAILSGPIASTLLSAATSYRADLIVLTCHIGVSSNGAQSFRLSSVAEKIVRWAKIPVLLLCENGSPPLWLYPRTDQRGSENLMPFSISADGDASHPTISPIASSWAPDPYTGYVRPTWLPVALNGTSKCGTESGS